MEDGYSYEDIEAIHINCEYDCLRIKVFYSWKNHKEIFLDPVQGMKLLEFAEQLKNQ